MKRLLIAVLASAPFLFGTAVASADGWGPSGPPSTPAVPVVGTVVSTDPANGTFVANAYAPAAQGGEFGDDFDFQGSPPPSTQVTISTDANTKLVVDDQPGTVADMSAGDRFAALFSGSPGDSLQTLVANPALAVFDHPADTQPAPAPHQLYAFVGTVTGVDTTGGTVTVDVTRSLPASLVPSGSAPAPFTVGTDTLVLGGTSTSLFGTLDNVSVGDIVAGGVIGDAGQTLTQIESTPLKLLLDLPAASGGSTAQTSALNRALALLGDRAAVKTHKAHKAHKSHKSHKSHKHARTHHSARANKHARRA